MFIQKFINRKEEINFLEREYKKDKPFFLVIYGRRRAGKTELIRQFIEGKKAIYFLATQEVEKENMASLSEELAGFFGDSSIKINPFSAFRQVMEYLKDKVKSIKSRTVIIIDEFPYLVDANKAVPSILQKYWDMHFKSSNLGLILCGSSIGAMESEVLGSKSPLYGRRTGQWKVEPLSFEDAIKLFPSSDFGSQIQAYSAIGGIPLYLLEMDPSLSILENIKSNVARKGAFLYEEVPFILKEELREPRVYFSLLKEISSGKTKLNDIKNAMGVERTLLGRYIETLETLGLIEKETAITAKPKSKNTLYVLKDNFFRFWFRFVFPHKKELERGEYKNFLAKLELDFNHFIGVSFEQICRDFLIKNCTPFQLSRIGRQWGKVPGASKEKNQYEIDICGINEASKEIIFGESKWQDNVDAKKVLAGLKEKAGYVDWHRKERKEHYAIFAKSFKGGFEEKNVQLFDLQQLAKLYR